VITAAYQVLDQSQNAYGSVDNLPQHPVNRQEAVAFARSPQSRASGMRFL